MPTTNALSDYLTDAGREESGGLLGAYKYSTRTCKYFASKYFSSSNYNVSPKENEWRNVNLVRANANFWVSPIEKANGVILEQWMFMRDNQFLKRYEFVED